jgi:hypothetical protein
VRRWSWPIQQLLEGTLDVQRSDSASLSAKLTWLQSMRSRVPPTYKDTVELAGEHKVSVKPTFARPVTLLLLCVTILVTM